MGRAFHNQKLAENVKHRALGRLEFHGGDLVGVAGAGWSASPHAAKTMSAGTLRASGHWRRRR
jgi:hypothetical protein